MSLGVKTYCYIIYKGSLSVSQAASGVSGQVQACVGERRVPGEEPCHHGERGALVPLGAALHWLEERSGAGLAGRGLSSLLLTRTEPFLILGISLGVITKSGYESQPSFF